jgi:serpin B
LGARSSPEADPEIPDISKRINAFTIDLLKYCAGVRNAPATTILSAQSIFHSLAMSYIASGGETRKELAEVFHFPDDNEELLKDLAKLRRQLDAAGKQKGIDVTLANSVWLDETYADFRREYVKKVEKVFDASLHRVKFEQRVQVSKDINKWISEKTHGRIQEGVSPRDFESRSTPGIVDEPALVCVNAVYFNADWASRFDKTSTRKEPFHVDASTTTEMMMMHQRALLPYFENENVKFLEIPYIDGSYSMYVVLPKEIISIRDLAETLSAEMVVGLKRSSFVHEVDVLFPKFEMKSHLGVKDALSDIGVKSAFDKQRADFDQMIIKKFEAFRIYISEIYHDAWIDVHEEGTEAASATTTTHFSFGCSAPPRPMPAQFHANHPFLFMIIHNQSRSILFAGWISNPEAIAQQVAPADAAQLRR